MHMSPTHNGSTVLQRFECGNAIEIRNGIMFGVYPGLPCVPTTLHHACYYRLKNMGYDWTLMDLVHQEIELIFVLCSYRYYVTSIFLVCVCTVL